MQRIVLCMWSRKSQGTSLSHMISSVCVYVEKEIESRSSKFVSNFSDTHALKKNNFNYLFAHLHTSR